MGRDFGQGRQHKGSLRQAGVGHLQPFAGNHLVAIQNQIEIKAAGPPVLQADAAEVLFRTQEQLQQRFSRQFGLQQGTAVDEVILGGSNRHGAIPT